MTAGRLVIYSAYLYECKVLWSRDVLLSTNFHHMKLASLEVAYFTQFIGVASIEQQTHLRK